MIKVGIIGATGYAGNELVRLLLGHKDAEIVWLGSRSYIDQNYSDVYRNMFKLVDAKCMDDNMEQLANEVDVIFTATPQGLCASLVNDEILSKTKIIDLSADFRLKDVNVYEQWYKLEHKAPQYIDEAVYGLCEINRDKVSKDTRIIANPGCYTTTSILTLYPMVKEGIINPDTIIIDAKSGTSGAGRGAKVANLFCEVNESMKAYGVGTHRHTPEIEEQLGYACGRDDLKLIFTPHLVPMNRGILVTAYANLAKDVTYEDDKYGITREELDEFSANSQQKCEKAIAEGKFADEIVPVPVKVKKEIVDFVTDEGPRAGTTAESLAKLKCCSGKEGGLVTAGNASGINDGAAAIVVMSEEKAKELGVTPMATWVAGALGGVEPEIMGVGPVASTKKVLAKTGLTIDDMDLIEANEAFAAQSIAVARDLHFDMSKVNVNGGAIALGHPVGASGCRILVTLLHEMQKRDSHRGLATLCIGGGMGCSTIVER